MDELAEKLGILEEGRTAKAPPAVEDPLQKKTGKPVLRKKKNVKTGPRLAAGQVNLNPPHGEKDSFEKVTVTLPGQIRRLLLDESHRRKLERDPNWSISVIVREALAAHLGPK